ncbi:ABC transporter permease [Pelagibacterium halotolerans]|uniref:Dipeptide transport system permease protein DppC n=1 Tax=Pelagibacterium halotolerans (strain DSM 22347 / JCM 15775 / CGMCC 1.7692 / B2) TaxID=1082931 RepID=G4R763_PELHB|nr:ABC transporter permease [Pelagibacterium halotolerans]AEQ50217.1 dipeptide transport system permease protein DppC [Pelagibacterium halotolerans B2]QJR19784.1 ABC transporter permease [Pelagibacterium halotolerans]SEA50915.1 peptide/nickel transport system permease protein [Pelagibacterium halotolerans]
MKKHFHDIPFTTRLAMVFLVALIVLGLGADFLAPYDYRDTDILARLQPPLLAGGEWDHVFGTDEIGRDVFSRILYGLRTSLLIAALGTMIGAIVGTLLGFVAAHLRGPAEQIIMAAVDFQAAVPFIILVLFFMAIAGSGLWIFLLLVGLAGWEVYARLTRGMVLSAKEQNYVLALQGLELSQSTIYLRHILPNIGSALIVQLTLNFPATVLLETGLSFLGLGVQPPNTSLGLMLGQGRNFLLNAWWIAVFPGSVIFLATLSMSILGDWLRDRLDPLSQSR